VGLGRKNNIHQFNPLKNTLTNHPSIQEGVHFFHTGRNTRIVSLEEKKVKG